MTTTTPLDTPVNDDELKARIEHLFASAFQDGFGCATNPKYKNRTVEHTDRAMSLIQKDRQHLQARMEKLRKQRDEWKSLAKKAIREIN